MIKSIFNKPYQLILVSSLFLHFFLLKSIETQMSFIVPALVSFFVSILIVFFEKKLPYKKDWQREKGDFYSDLINSFLILPVFVQFAKMTTSFFYQNIGFSLDLSSLNMGLLVESLLLILACEFLFYWTHRSFHKVGKLWSFHTIHHNVSRVYWANSGRFHPFDTFITFSLYLLLIPFLGVGEDSIILFFSLNAITGLLEHANIDYDIGRLNYIFNSAQLHRIHHNNDAKIGDSNFGKITCFWDLVFNTFRFDANINVENIGISSGDKVRNNIFKQISYPFEKS